jgi:hypothetical protein
MARIRSVHPGLWTDEAFVEMTVNARLFLIGIWNEADDCGLLEWRPTRLKMRLAPADAIDADAIMDELVRFGFLVRFSRGGNEYAAVKNFRKYQRPKNPSSPILPLDDELRAIVGIKEGDSPTPALPQPFPERAEKVEQMEDGVGGDKGREEAIASSSAEAKLSISEMVRRLEQATDWLGLPGEGVLSQLVAEGHSFEDRILPLARDEAERRHEPPKSWTYLAAVVRDATRRPTASAKLVETVWVPQGSDAWKALVAGGKRESWLRTMLKPDGKGGEGIWFASDQIPASKVVA